MNDSGHEIIGALCAGLAQRPAFESLWSTYVLALRAYRTPLVMDAAEAEARREAVEGARVVLACWYTSHGYRVPVWCAS